MIDNLSILLSHALLAYAFWILTTRVDLDAEPPAPKDPEPEGFKSGLSGLKRRTNAMPDGSQTKAGDARA